MKRQRAKADDKGITQVNFKADAATIAAIDKIAASRQGETGALTGGGRSQAIRRAILELAARL